MKNRAFTAAALVAAVLLGYAFTRTSKAQGLRQPFTMIVVSQGSEPPPVAGREALGIRRLFAVRSDGSTVTASLTPEGDLKSLPQFGDRTVYLHPQGQYVYVLDKLKLKSTTPLKASSRMLPPNPTCSPADDGKSKPLGTDTVVGWLTYIYERSDTAANGSRETRTRWLVPALDCREVQSRLELTPAAGPARIMWNRPVSITAGEPDPALFAVPGEYRDVSPGELEGERAKALGRTALPPSLEERLKSRDEDYTRGRSK
jgi:hypothetical protein